MAKYHISPRTGTPVQCKAVYRCPFGGPNEHYETEMVARRAYEQKMKEYEIPSFTSGKIRVSELPEDMILDNKTVLVPKGMYVVGDPAKTLGLKDQDSLKKWNNKISEGPNKDNIARGATLNGYPVISLKTKFGDGVYFDNSERDYHIDSQMLSLTPLPLLKKMGVTEDEINNSFSTIVSFNEPTKIFYEDGTIHFGKNMQIFTDVNPNIDSSNEEFTYDSDIDYDNESSYLDSDPYSDY